MDCGVGLCGHCQLGPFFVCRDGPVFSRRRARRPASGGRGCDVHVARRAAAPARRRRQVRLLRRLPADAPRPRGRAAADRRSASTSSSSPRRPRSARTGPFDVLLVEGSVSTPGPGRGDRRAARAHATLLVTHRRLRHRRRHPGAAQLGRPRAGVPRRGLPRPGATSSRWRPSTPDRRPRRGRRRAARLPDRPDAAARAARPRCASAAGRSCRTRRSASSASGAASVCVLVAEGVPCLGPVTQTGCGALCPAFGRGCYGCFGPREQANVAALARAGSRERPADRRRSTALFAGFTAWAPPFRELGERGPCEPHEPRRDGGRRCMTDGDTPMRGTDRRRATTVAPADPRRGRGLARLRVRDGEVDRGAPRDLRGAALLRAARRRPRRRTRSSTSSRASAASARSPTR